MKLRSGTIAAALLQLVFATIAGAQPHVLYGITAHYEEEIPGRFLDPGYEEFCGCDPAGRQRGRASHFAASITLPRLFNDLTLGLRFGSRSTQELFISPRYISVGTPDTLLEYRADSRLRSAQLDLLAGHHLGGGLILTGGAWLDARFSNERTSHERIIGPAATRFGDGTGERLLSAAASGTGPITAGLTLGLSLGLQLDHNWYLYPELYVRTDLTSLLGETGSPRFRIGGGTSVMLDFSEAPPAPDLPEPVPPPDPAPEEPPSPIFTAALDLHTVGADGGRTQQGEIMRRTTHHRMNVPLTGTIYYDRDSMSIPGRYREALEREGASFTIDSLARRGPLEIHYRELNVIGRRMREEKEATIVIIGGIDGAEPSEMGRGRALLVREYLAGTWGISPARMTVRAARRSDGSTGGSPMGRMVRITSTSSSLLAPVSVEWLGRSYILPRFILKPSMKSAAGIRRWGIVVRWRGDRVGETSSEPEKSAGREITLEIPEEAGPDLPPLIAELTVEDSAGAIRTAIDELPLALDTVTGSDAIDREFLLIDYPSGLLPDGTPPPEATITEGMQWAAPSTAVTISPMVSQPDPPSSGAVRALVHARSLARVVDGWNTGAAVEVREGTEIVPDSPEAVLILSGTRVRIRGGR